MDAVTIDIAAETPEPPRTAADVVAGLLASIAGITGIAAEPAGDAAVRITADCWSPSLHRVTLDLKVPTTPATAGVAEPIRQALLYQRERAAHAATLGIDAPLRLADADTRVDHLHMDRAVREIIVAAGLDPASEVRDILMRLPAITDGGTALLGNEGAVLTPVEVAVAESTNPDAPQQPHRLALVAVTIPNVATRGGGEVGTNGLTASIPIAQLPESIAVSLVGRTLGSLVRVHPALDGRIVTRVDNARSNDRTVIVHFRPDPVPVVDAPATATA